MSDLIALKAGSPTMQDIEKFTTLLNSEPDSKWLQDTPDKKAKYIPIGLLENELRKDFAGLVQYEILSERRELNEYIVTARIKVFHPVVGQWMYYDGIGCVQIMQDSGASLSSFNETKKKNALEMNAPKALAEAIKNAAKRIGKKYGADLNRKFEDVYEPQHTLAATLDEVIEKLKQCGSTEELKELWAEYPDLQKSARFKHAFTTRNKEVTI